MKDDDGECDEDFSVNVVKTLLNLPAGGIKDGTSITVEDFQQDLEVVLNFTHRETELWDEEETPDMFVIGDKMPESKKKKAEVDGNEKAADTKADADKKRKTMGDEENEKVNGNVSKKMKADKDDEIEII